MPELPPDVKAELEKQKETCVFCRIIEGRMQSHTVYEDPVLKVLLDINPAAPGHMLIVPREHYPLINMLPDPSREHLFGLLPELSRDAQKSMLASGISLVVASGAAAGQQSAHFLMHMCPREPDDMIAVLPKTPGAELDKLLHDGIADALKARLASALPGVQGNSSDGPGPGEGRPQGMLAVYSGGGIELLNPERVLAAGHFALRLQGSPAELGTLSPKECNRLMSAAVFVASSVFEAAGAAGTNIVMHSGLSPENPDGGLVLHVVPRKPGDRLEIGLVPMKKRPELKGTAERLRDGFFVLMHRRNHVQEKEDVVDLDRQKQVISGDRKDDRPQPKTGCDEIKEAIRKVAGD